MCTDDDKSIFATYPSFWALILIYCLKSVLCLFFFKTGNVYREGIIMTLSLRTSCRGFSKEVSHNSVHSCGGCSKSIRLFGSFIVKPENEM